MAAPCELIYYTGVPGRGEHIRLALEEAGAPYTDTGSLGMAQCREIVTKYLTERNQDEKENPPYYAPPLFKHGNLIINQTPNILMYLGSKLGLAGSQESDAYRVNALVLTALDGLSNEVHDTHHPIAVMLPYEEQKEESKRRSTIWINTRLPKILEYWESALVADEKGPWLLGSTFTYADLVLFQCIDGTQFAFPRALRHFKQTGQYDHVFKLWEDVKARPNVAAYLGSERRQKYDWGIYRHYADNDVLPE